MGFNFPAAGGVAPGDCSAVLIVETNATAYTAGTLNIIDGSVASVASYAPAVPEPETIILLGAGLVALAGLVRRSL